MPLEIYVVVQSGREEPNSGATIYYTIKIRVIMYKNQLEFALRSTWFRYHALLEMPTRLHGLNDATELSELSEPFHLEFYRSYDQSRWPVASVSPRGVPSETVPHGGRLVLWSPKSQCF